jgi:hypothetical protein
MSDTNRSILVGTPGPTPRTVRLPTGEVWNVPDGWELLLPGDAGVTRRVKAAGEHWTIAEKRGRKSFARGVWAPATTIRNAQAALDAERSAPGYSRKQEAAARRREKVQSEYVEDFHAAVLSFLHFAPVHAELAEQMAQAITAHATPVGSGTVARTQRIPLEQRAEAAVLAWMRHQATNYDRMTIARVRGKRREVRRELAELSRMMLANYRAGAPLAADCPLALAIQALPQSTDEKPPKSPPPPPLGRANLPYFQALQAMSPRPEN